MYPYVYLLRNKLAENGIEATPKETEEFICLSQMVLNNLTYEQYLEICRFSAEEISAKHNKHMSEGMRCNIIELGKLKFGELRNDYDSYY